MYRSNPIVFKPKPNVLRIYDQNVYPVGVMVSIQSNLFFSSDESYLCVHLVLRYLNNNILIMRYCCLGVVILFPIYSLKQNSKILSSVKTNEDGCPEK